VGKLCYDFRRDRLKEFLVQYSLPDVCALFDIDPVTLRRWLRRAGLSAGIDQADRRRRYLSEQALVSLARQHQRVLAGSLAEQCRCGCAVELAELRARVAALELRLSDDVRARASE
jgi:transposase-like protein